MAATKLSDHACLEGLSNIVPPLTPEEAVAGEVILIGNVLELLYTLIGETMALQLVQGVWGDGPVIDPDFRKEGKNG